MFRPHPNLWKTTQLQARSIVLSFCLSFFLSSPKASEEDLQLIGREVASLQLTLRLKVVVFRPHLHLWKTVQLQTRSFFLSFFLSLLKASEKDLQLIGREVASLQLTLRLKLAVFRPHPNLWKTIQLKTLSFCLSFLLSVFLSLLKAVLLPPSSIRHQPGILVTPSPDPATPQEARAGREGQSLLS